MIAGGNGCRSLSRASRCLRLIHRERAYGDDIRNLVGTSIAVIHSDRDFATLRLCVIRMRLDMIENKNHGGRVLHVPSW
jgi:hypothetical protein